VIEPDDTLLERLGRGDDAAFEQLFVRHYNQVYRVLYGLLGNPEAAEDLAQETFLELYGHAPAGTRPGATLAAWLCRVALNKGYNSLRGERRAQQRLERFAAVAREEAGPEDEIIRSEERALVREVLARLPERQSKLLLLRHAGLSLAEIGNALEVAQGSVGTLLVRAERAFANAYELMDGRGGARTTSAPEKRKL
jgi:RNA polymerase sigma-70 factor (ECF subfamily)